MQTFGTNDLMMIFIKFLLAITLMFASAPTNVLHRGNSTSGFVGNNLAIEQEKQCIAEALYYEARGEGEEGMRYVLSVIHNRKNSIGFPNSYCKVIHQSRQFSYRNGVNPGLNVTISPQRLHDQQSYTLASAIAEEAAYGRFKPLLDRDVLWYHTSGVKPKWSRVMQKVKTVTKHQFFKKKE